MKKKVIKVMIFILFYLYFMVKSFIGLVQPYRLTTLETLAEKGQIIDKEKWRIDKAVIIDVVHINRWKQKDEILLLLEIESVARRKLKTRVYIPAYVLFGSFKDKRDVVDVAYNVDKIEKFYKYDWVPSVIYLPSKQDWLDEKKVDGFWFLICAFFVFGGIKGLRNIYKK